MPTDGIFSGNADNLAKCLSAIRLRKIHPNPGPPCRKGMRKEDLRNCDWRIDKKAKKEETRQKKERIETDYHVEPPRPVTETIQ